ncbi:MAG: N-acetyl-gamma-glutamyl-phosphate reductase [Gammaproteobacteria bacterium]|nr:N-acetyl-gamma-glutamyl-phosphate reductase [Gammaproteobacteria bacterium]
MSGPSREAPIRAAIVGGSGYSGGELLRLLHFHPAVEVVQVTSERLAGKFVHSAHPNLRQVSRLKFCALSELEACDVLFLCLPHGSAVQHIDRMRELAPRIIDSSADFRLTDPALYQTWYGKPHPRPELLGQFAYGIPEVNREAIRQATEVACAGCNATATILALRPFVKRGLVERAVVEVKAGSSEGGNAVNEGSHHPERSGAVRSYKPSGHRHTAEMIQVLGDVPVHFSATSIEMVRGILATCHLFLSQDVSEKDVWKILREDYGDEPFVRIVKERSGIYRYPEPKILSGTNYCDIGFERDEHARRLVVISAIDNLMKGAAGQAVQAFNLMHGLAESCGLEFPGLHPI